MKPFSWIIVSSGMLALLILVFLMPAHVEAAPAPHAPIVVELFTSEGCSSCPPADQLLLELQKLSRPDAEIFVLSEHVDYWNYIGWRDPFSSRQFSDRQSAYARALGLDEVFTPQMVVDGVVAFSGRDGNRIAKEIANAAERPKGSLAVETREMPGNVLSVATSGDALKDKSLMVTLAVTEDGLQSQVKRGENSGRTITHTGVVRALKEVRAKDSTAKVDFKMKPEWRRENLRIVTFAQDKSRKVVAAGMYKLQ